MDMALMQIRSDTGRTLFGLSYHDTRHGLSNDRSLPRRNLVGLAFTALSRGKTFQRVHAFDLEGYKRPSRRENVLRRVFMPEGFWLPPRRHNLMD